MPGILVLGCGMIGSAVAMDLARGRDWAVTVADRDSERLARLRALYGVRTITADVADGDRIHALARDCDLVVSALPSRIGYRALEATIQANRHAVCISFTPEDPRALDALARDRQVTALVDCGVAPGLSNMMAGAAVAQLSTCDRLDIYVGGIPADRTAPFEYKAGFSPSDVIEEYVDPARVVENGHVVVKEALSEIEHIEFPGIGTLEAFLTDGLRSLIDTLPIPFMREKTLRYPGHARAMRALRDSGFFSKEPVRVDGLDIRPLDLTAALLFPRWTYREGEEDLTVLRVIVSGRRTTERVRVIWELVDRYDAASGLRSMSRTTAFPATIVAGLIADGAIPPGVHPPEIIGRLGLLEEVVRELDARGVHCTVDVERQPISPRPT